MFVRFNHYLLAALLTISPWACAAPRPVAVTVQVTPRPAATFIPAFAFGGAVDGLEQGDIARVYTASNIRAIANAGYGTLSYRLRTELAVAAWHWNPAGRWSDPARQQGYWTSNARPASPVTLSYGYALPRRGSTTDQAGNDGYSRLDDGDPRTFWKSNPYLDASYTGEPNALHPQWVVIDLGRVCPVTMLHILWGDVYASRFHADWWQAPVNTGDELDETFDPAGRWHPCPAGEQTGAGGVSRVTLSRVPIRTRYLRLWLTESAGGNLHASDPRDRVGYAIRELGVGTENTHGMFQDLVRHAPARDRQTKIYVSSTDPWHGVHDRNPNLEQPGLDRVLRSPLAHGLPSIVPVAVLYDTPDNAAAEIRYLEARHYPLRGVEMGEEPDGQYCAPEDYAALYREWAAAIHAVDPHLLLGGPGFQTNTGGWPCWPDSHGDRSWLRRFLQCLARHGQMANFNFLSFEWYPFDDLPADTTAQLLAAPALLRHSLALFKRDGIPPHFPLVIGEYGYSSYSARAEMDLPGALLDMEIAAQFLSLGGSVACVYGLEPNVPIHERGGVAGWGNLALFLSDDNRHIRQPLAAYWAERLLTQIWAMPASRSPHDLYATMPDSPFVTAYAVHRPDGLWSVMLLNKDAQRSARVTLRFRRPHSNAAFDAPIQWQYGRAQYVWHPRRAHGDAFPDLPPVRRTLAHARTFLLPPLSLTVIRGHVSFDNPPRRPV